MTLLAGPAPSPASSGREFDRYNDNAFASLLRGVASHSPESVFLKNLVSQILVSTTSAVVRDAAAIALVDLDAREEIGALLAVIHRPDVADHAGTLLFALDELGAAIPLELVVSLIERGSYEAKAEAVLLVQSGRLALPPSADDLDVARQHLNVLATSQNADVREAAAVVLAHLS